MADLTTTSPVRPLSDDDRTILRAIAPLNCYAPRFDKPLAMKARVILARAQTIDEATAQACRRLVIRYSGRFDPDVVQLAGSYFRSPLRLDAALERAMRTPVPRWPDGLMLGI